MKHYQTVRLLLHSSLLLQLAVTAAHAAPGSASSMVSTSNVPTIFRYDAKKLRPDASLLSSDQVYYLYQGHRIVLRRMTDRYALHFRDSSAHASPALRKKPGFKNGAFRKVQSGNRPIDIFMFKRQAAGTGRNGNFTTESALLQSEIVNDPTVTGSPVYYNAATNSEVVFADRIAVKFSNDDAALRAHVAALLEAEIEKQLMPSVFTYRCNNIAGADAATRCHRIEELPGVEWAEPEMLSPIEHYFTPNDPNFTDQWLLNNTGRNSARIGADMKITSAWDIQQMGNPAVNIAILDDGVDLAHPDLSIKSGGRDFYNSDNDPAPVTPDDNHGTAVAGVAAAIGNNAIGIAGVAAGSKIFPVKISQGTDFVSWLSIAEAITWAYENGADILNNSWGGPGESPSVTSAIINASRLGRGGKGCPVFCASGNGASPFTTYTIPVTGATRIAVAFVYKKNGSVSQGEDFIAIDNIVHYGNGGSTVLATETFSSAALPDAWTTGGGNNSSPAIVAGIPGWTGTTTTCDRGFGDNVSLRSGAVTDNQWTELRMPLTDYSAGDVLAFRVRLSTEENGDSLKIRFYIPDGSMYSETGIGAGITTSTPTVSFPAAGDSAIAVGASNDQDFRTAYSQFDVAGTAKSVDFLAPSGGGWNYIMSTDRTGEAGYSSTDYTRSFSGTSSASPAAAGVAALILSRNPQLSRNKVLEVMRASCDKIGGVTYTGGRNNEYGYGRLNARQALLNLPPVITGQNPVGGVRNSTITLTTDDLIIFDTEMPVYPFTLSVYPGSNYTVSGTTITPGSGYSGTLSVPVSVRDETYESDRFTLSVNVRSTNSAPVITAQSAVSMPEDGKRLVTRTDFTITDSDDPSGPFTIAMAPGANYTIVNDTVVPAADFFGTLSIAVTASDGYSTSAPFTMTASVLSVNDAPGFTPGSNITVDEDAGAYSAGWATNISRGPSNEAAQSVAFIPTLSASGLFLAPPSLSIDGILTFTPAANASGIATIQVRLFDNGGTNNSGVNASTEYTFTVTIRAVNDPPVFTPGGDVPVVEEAGLQTITSWARDIGSGAPNETGQLLDFIVTTANDALFTVLPVIDAGGTLTFTPAPDASGSVPVTVRLHDNGGGTDLSTPATFTINIEAVNDAPSFTPGGSPSVSEDAGAQSTGWATVISAGPGESSQLLSFTATTSAPALFSAQPAIDPNGTLTYTPAANAWGSATVTVRLRDNGGTGRSGVDSSAQSSFTITINAVNDPPTFSPGPAVTVSEDAGAQTITAWGTISTGPPDENGQTVDRAISTTNLSLFTVPPSLGADGTLIFTPAVNSSGTSVVTVTLTDNGGTDRGGVPTFTAAPFTITVEPVNDAPSFVGGSDIHLSEDAPAHTVSAWATQMNAGPGESGQGVSFSVGSSNNALFSTLPALDALGTLSFTLAPNAYGSTLLSVRLHDNGGTDRGGCDSSAVTTAIIEIASVNDVPRLAISGTLDIPSGTAGTITVSATDADGTVPVIRTAPLPPFVSFSSTPGSGSAILACASNADTGTYAITLTADDGSTTIDSTITIRILPTPTGTIEITGIPAEAAVSLFATSCWTGKTARTGPGLISRLTVGTYLLTVTHSGFRTEYRIASAKPNGIDTVNVILRTPVPSTFAAASPIGTASTPLNAGTPVSAVFDDLDNDGKRDVVYLGADGTVRFVRNNGTTFEPTIDVVQLYSGRNTLRCIDWNADKINDILSVNIVGSVYLSLGKGALAFKPDSLLFNVTPGCTGFELFPGSTGHPTRFYFGFSSGTVTCVQAVGATRTTLPVRLLDGTPVDVGDDANLTMLDINGDDRPELLIGNAVGSIDAFTLVAADTVRALGKVAANGSLLTGAGGILLSSTFGDAAGDLPKLVWSDGNGALFTAGSTLRGDMNGDGVVDVLDLQQLGIHWGQRSGEAGWSGMVNLNVGSMTSELQVINVLDLQVLGNCWGLKK